MIVSYRGKRTQRFAEGLRVKAFGRIARRAEMRLDQLEAATSLLDLDLPGNRLEALKGDRKGQYSIRINDQWRGSFLLAGGGGGAGNREVLAYHQEGTTCAHANHPGGDLSRARR